MTLGFSQFTKPYKNGSYTFFAEKILWPYVPDIQKYFPDMLPKIHTFRAGFRWKEGKEMHMVYGNRTKNRVQFNADIPELKYCKGVQYAFIVCSPNKPVAIQISNPGDGSLIRELSPKELLLFAANDGFNSLEELTAFFSPDNSHKIIHGQIIHFTDFRY